MLLMLLLLLLLLLLPMLLNTFCCRCWLHTFVTIAQQARVLNINWRFPPLSLSATLFCCLSHVVFPSCRLSANIYWLCSTACAAFDVATTLWPGPKLLVALTAALTLPNSFPLRFVCVYVCVFAFGLAKCANGMTPISINVRLCLEFTSCNSAELLTHLSESLSLSNFMWESQTVRPFCNGQTKSIYIWPIGSNLNNWQLQFEINFYLYLVEVGSRWFHFWKT